MLNLSLVVVNYHYLVHQIYVKSAHRTLYALSLLIFRVLVLQKTLRTNAQVVARNQNNVGRVAKTNQTVSSHFVCAHCWHF